MHNLSISASSGENFPKCPQGDFCGIASYPLSILVGRFFTPSVPPTHDASDWHRSRCDHAASPSGYEAAGLQGFSRLDHAADLSPEGLYTPWQSGDRVASPLAPCDTGRYVNVDYNRAASPPDDVCRFAASPAPLHHGCVTPHSCGQPRLERLQQKTKP